MGFLGTLFGNKASPAPQPPPPPAQVKPPEVKAPLVAEAPLFVSPFEAIAGAVAARAAFKSGQLEPAQKLYAAVNDGGFREALVKELADTAPILPGAVTPFDAPAEAGDPFWRMVRGMYEIRVGWDARGSGTADTVSDDGATTLMARCKRAVDDLELAAAALIDDEVPYVLLMIAARGMGAQSLGDRAYRDAMGRNPTSWAAGNQRVTWLSPRWYGSVDEVLEFARGESRRVGEGELAALPVMAQRDVHFYRSVFEKDADAARKGLHAAVPELADACARSVDAAGARTVYSTPIVRHFAGSLFWRAADEPRAKAQLSKAGNVFEAQCWGGAAMENFLNTRKRLGL